MVVEEDNAMARAVSLLSSCQGCHHNDGLMTACARERGKSMTI